MAWSLLIQNGLVIDGSGAPAVRADVAVEGGRVAAVDAGLRGPAERTIDATGHYVTPGFIDIHSHSDLFYLACPAAESKVRQGCTTEVVGMCSFSPAPVHPARKETVRAWAGGIGARLEVEWETFGQYLDVLRAARPSINIVHMVGHGALRLAALGPDNRAATPDDLRAMERLLAEAIQIGEVGGVAVQIAHVKAAGPENWGKLDRVLRLIDTARARGLDVTGDVYPYNAGSTKMDNLLPPWMHDGGVSKLLARLADRPTRRRVVEECLIDGERWRTPMGSLGFDQIFVATCSRPELEGLDLAHLGRATGGTPAEAMLSLVAEERAGVSMVVFSQSEDNVAKVLAHPAVMIGSDSLGLSAGPGPHPGKPHPRMYGTFPRVLGVYVREKKLFAWETAVHKMTGMPAAKLRLRDRGLVRPGYAADLAVFDPARVKDTATYADPHRHPTGIPWVLVNGAVVVDQGRMNAAGGGQVLTPA